MPNYPKQHQQKNMLTKKNNFSLFKYFTSQEVKINFHLVNLNYTKKFIQVMEKEIEREGRRGSKGMKKEQENQKKNNIKQLLAIFGSIKNNKALDFLCLSFLLLIHYILLFYYIRHMLSSHNIHTYLPP